MRLFFLVYWGQPHLWHSHNTFLHLDLSQASSLQSPFFLISSLNTSLHLFLGLPFTPSPFTCSVSILFIQHNSSCSMCHCFHYYNEEQWTQHWTLVYSNIHTKPLTDPSYDLTLVLACLYMAITALTVSDCSASYKWNVWMTCTYMYNFTYNEQSITVSKSGSPLKLVISGLYCTNTIQYVHTPTFHKVRNWGLWHPVNLEHLWYHPNKSKFYYLLLQFNWVVYTNCLYIVWVKFVDFYYQKEHFCWAYIISIN